MRRWLALTAKLYPGAWRQRYGAEFDALMEDVEPDCQELANVMGGALRMHMKSDTAFRKLAAALAVFGALAALAVSFRMPDRYVSSAVLKMTPPKERAEAEQLLSQMLQEILSRSSLAELIQRPSLNLYPGERQRMPLEDVVSKMRRDILIRAERAVDGGPRTFTVSFIYPDLVKAQAVTGVLTTKYIETNLMVNRNRAMAWRNAWHEDAPPGDTLEVISRASDPKKAGETNRVVFAVAGLLAGIVLASVLRWPGPAVRLAACTLAGCALAGAASYLISNQYISSAVMRITPPLDPKRWYAGGPVESPSERIQRMEQAVLSSANLEKLILRPNLDLYRTERSKTPIQDIVRNMRDHDIRIHMLLPATFVISFRYRDPRKAQAVVRELVTQFTEVNITEERERMKTAGPEVRMMADHKLGENLEVLDPASLPVTPASPNRVVIAGIGLAVGLLMGIASLFRRRPPRPAMPVAEPTPA